MWVGQRARPHNVTATVHKNVAPAGGEKAIFDLLVTTKHSVLLRRKIDNKAPPLFSNPAHKWQDCCYVAPLTENLLKKNNKKLQKSLWQIYRKKRLKSVWILEIWWRKLLSEVSHALQLAMSEDIDNTVQSFLWRLILSDAILVCKRQQTSTVFGLMRSSRTTAVNPSVKGGLLSWRSDSTATGKDEMLSWEEA